MSPVLVLVLTRLYPRAWRERYGAEFEMHLLDTPGGTRTAIDVAWAAMKERIAPTVGGNMERPVYSFAGVMKQPSAYVPVAMSFTALALVLIHLVIYGVAREADEGPTAHLWQLLMGAQLPVLGFFAVQWLRRAPRQALGVMAVQAVAVMAAVAPVFYFNL